MEYVIHFGFTSDRLWPLELRDLAQWTVKPQLLAVPGVAQAQILGGQVRERQVEVDPVKLAAYELSLDDVVDATRPATAAIRRSFPRTPPQPMCIPAQRPGP